MESQKAHTTHEIMPSKKRVIPFKKDNKIMRHAKTIAIRHENGMPVPGYINQIEKKSSYSDAQRKYVKSVEESVIDGDTRMDQLYVDMIREKNVMLRSGAIMLLEMIQEADTLTNAAAILEKRANRTDLYKNKQKNTHAAIAVKREAMKAYKLADAWKGQYKVEDATLVLDWNVPILVEKTL